MVSVSFKNIHIWPKMARMPIFGQTFFVYNVSGPIGLIFLGVQKTIMIIFRLLMRHLSYDAYISFLIFWTTFGGKWAWPPCAPLMVLDPKIWPTRNHVFEIFISKTWFGIIVVCSKGPPSEANFGPGLLGARVVATPIFLPKVTLKINIISWISQHQSIYNSLP